MGSEMFIGDRLWYSYWFPMTLVWFPHGFPIVLLWVPYGFLPRLCPFSPPPCCMQNHTRELHGAGRSLASHLPTYSMRKSIGIPHHAIQCGDHGTVDMPPHVPGGINTLLICLLIKLLTVLVMVGINARFSVRIIAQISAWGWPL